MTRPFPPDLDSAGWLRIRAALEEALGHDSRERARVLEERLGEVPRLLDVGLELLARDREEAPTLPEGASRQEGLRVGPYATRRVIGAGGMGTVYLAVRADGAFQRQVALKLIRPHLDTREVLARFRRERQVQANLEHPGIVRLLDGGATDEGLPYLVMEFVEGQPIDQYCDHHRLTNDERLSLFRKVASAVQHAHEQLVVHRDLKPSNILVTHAGEPKLLDFGIAKVLDPEKLSADVEVTREAMRFVTPAYASPEQLRGLPVTAASDIYSLGVLLYRLLTGHPPHRLDGLSPAEVERQVCEIEPSRPSDAVQETRELPAADRRGATTRITPSVVSERRRTTPRALRKSLAGDLDRMVQMCLRKEPQRRYASAAALGEDVDRFLEGRPIFARPDSLVYRTRKFVARNRLPVATIVVLAGSLGYSLVQNRRVVRAHAAVVTQKGVADDRLAQLRSMRSAIVREVKNLGVRVPEALEESASMMQVLLKDVDEEAALAGDDLRWLCEIGDLYAELGGIFFSGRSSNLGRAEEARLCYERALEVFEHAARSRPAHRDMVIRMGNALEAMGAVYISEGDHAAAATCNERVLELVAPFSPESESKDPSLVMQWCQAHNSLCRIRTVQGRTDEAREHAEASLATWRGLLARRPADELILAGAVDMARVWLADVMINQGQYADALEALQACEPGLRRAQRAHGSLQDPSRTWGTFLLRKARALEGLGRPGARELLQEAVQNARTAAHRAPQDLRSSSDLGISLTELAEHLLEVGDLEAAAASVRECLEHGEKFLETWPDLVWSLWRLGRAEVLMAEFRLEEGALIEASELLGSGASRIGEAVRRSPGQWGLRVGLAEASILLGRVQLAEADRASDAEVRRRALEQARVHVGRALGELDAGEGLGGVESRRLEADALAWSADVEARLAALE